MSEIKVGDHVWLDDPGPKKVHWIVQHIGTRETGPSGRTTGKWSTEQRKRMRYAHLKSGLTGISKRGVAIDRLTLHTKGNSDAEPQEQE